MEGRLQLIFRGVYRLSGTRIVECLVGLIWNSLMAWHDWLLLVKYSKHESHKLINKSAIIAADLLNNTVHCKALPPSERNWYIIIFEKRA